MIANRHPLRANGHFNLLEKPGWRRHMEARVHSSFVINRIARRSRVCRNGIPPATRRSSELHLAIMPAKSKKQQMAAGAALSAKRGETPKSELKGASKQMADSMSENQLEELAATKRKNLPKKAK
jgi:hypothetical protein